MAELRDRFPSAALTPRHIQHLALHDKGALTRELHIAIGCLVDGAHVHLRAKSKRMFSWIPPVQCARQQQLPYTKIECVDPDRECSPVTYGLHGVIFKAYVNGVAVACTNFDVRADFESFRCDAGMIEMICKRACFVRMVGVLDLEMTGQDRPGHEEDEVGFGEEAGDESNDAGDARDVEGGEQNTVGREGDMLSSGEGRREGKDDDDGEEEDEDEEEDEEEEEEDEEEDELTQAAVFEFMDNGSLLDMLSSEPDLLHEELRMEVVLCVAEGLSVLHSLSPPLIHRNVTASSVLFDIDMRPRLNLTLASADVWWREEMDDIGAMIPDPRHSEMSDVFFFGHLLLLLWCPAFADSEWPACQFSPELVAHAMSSHHVPPSIVALARQCIHTEARERPTMEAVLAELRAVQQCTGSA